MLSNGQRKAQSVPAEFFRCSRSIGSREVSSVRLPIALTLAFFLTEEQSQHSTTAWKKMSFTKSGSFLPSLPDASLTSRRGLTLQTPAVWGKGQGKGVNCISSLSEFEAGPGGGFVCRDGSSGHLGSTDTSGCWGFLGQGAISRCSLAGLLLSGHPLSCLLSPCPAHCTQMAFWPV